MIFSMEVQLEAITCNWFDLIVRRSILFVEPAVEVGIFEYVNLSLYSDSLYKRIAPVGYVELNGQWS